MSRRNGSEKILLASSYAILGGNEVAADSGIQLVEGELNVVISPRLLVVTGDGAGSAEITILSASGLNAADTFEHIHTTNQNTTETISFPDGFELPKSSGVYYFTESASSSVTLHYVRYDLGGGVTKEAARAASLQLGNATATRAPNFFGGQAKT